MPFNIILTLDTNNHDKAENMRQTIIREIGKLDSIWSWLAHKYKTKISELVETDD